MAAVLGRYARAFADVVVTHKLDPDKTVEELAEVAQLIHESRELRNVLANPAVSREQKLKLLDAITKRLGGSKLLRNFLAVLIDHRRIAHIGEVVKQFKEEMDRRIGIAEAQVRSARTLSPAEKKLLEKQLADVTGMTVRATYAEDTALLGGVLVRVGSTIYDGSVHGQLERLREQITET
ncbi:MAG: ATP synthase F1 subunit delta [Candidatus Angelobacter sp.]